MLNDKKGVPPGSHNNAQWSMAYQLPKKLTRFKAQTPLLSVLKKCNPKMHISVIYQNIIYAVVVHYENWCFCECNYSLLEADAALFLLMEDKLSNVKKFIIPDDIY